MFTNFCWQQINCGCTVNQTRQPIDHKINHKLENIFTYNHTDFIKNRVAVGIHFPGKESDYYEPYSNHFAWYKRDKIDVGVEILPMKSLQAEMSSGVSYYEGELYNVVRQGRGVPAVPLVIIGIEP